MKLFKPIGVNFNPRPLFYPRFLQFLPKTGTVNKYTTALKLLLLLGSTETQLDNERPNTCLQKHQRQQ